MAANKTPFDTHFESYNVAQLEAAKRQTEDGVVYYHLSEAAFVGNSRWFILALFAPQLNEAGDVTVRLSGSYIPGARTSKKVAAAVTLGTSTTDANWKNLNSAYIRLEDLFSHGCLPGDIFDRVRTWALNNLEGGAKLQLIPQAGGFFAFSLRFVVNPQTGEPARSPIGINEFELSGFGLNSGSVIRSFSGEHRAAVPGQFAVRVETTPVAPVVADPIDDGIEDAVYNPTIPFAPSTAPAEYVPGLVHVAAPTLSVMPTYNPLGDEDIPY